MNWCGTPFGDREHVALAQLVLLAALDGRGPQLARGDLVRVDHLAACDHGRLALTTCMTSTSCSWYSASPGASRRPASIL